MAAQYSVPDPGTPGKMYMSYQGLASYLTSGGKPNQLCMQLFCLPLETWERQTEALSASIDDNYWVIDTDYDNYAITYACRKMRDDGSCEDGYALVYSRNPRGLIPAVLKAIRQKQEEICMAGEFQSVLQSGTSQTDPPPSHTLTSYEGLFNIRQ